MFLTDKIARQAILSLNNFREIPPKIKKKILELDIESPIGGIPRQNSVHDKLENLYALDQGLDLLQITEVNSRLFLEFLTFTTTSNSDTKILRDLLKQNPDLLIFLVSKSKDICIYSTETYLQKLGGKQFDYTIFYNIIILLLLPRP